jgi:hypothetical protein
VALFIAGSALLAKSPVNEPTGLAVYAFNRPNLDWKVQSSKHFRIYYLPGSTAEHQIDTLLVQNEESLASHLELLKAPEYNRVIDLFYFDTRHQIEEIVTKPFRALADAESMTVLAVRNDEDIARDAHEIMHVVSFDLWGEWDRRNELAWLSEGLATYADKPCSGYEMSVLAAHILKNTKDSVPLGSLATKFREYPEMIGYIQMASFVEFVIDEYGIDRLRALWDDGYAGVEKVLENDLASVEQDWHEFVLRKYPDPQVPDWPDLKENGCK